MVTVCCIIGAYCSKFTTFGVYCVFVFGVIGVLFRSAHNKQVLARLLAENDLEFHKLIDSQAAVYLSRTHPLSQSRSITLEALKPDPCLSFDQGEASSSFLAEEILSEKVYSQTVQVNDRSTMLNLMVGLHGYTLCSGIISGDLNGDGYVVVPFHEDEENPNSIMEIGYITKKNSILSKMGEEYIEELKNYLKGVQGEAG